MDISVILRKHATIQHKFSLAELRLCTIYLDATQ